jgi:tetratricopeptide (TPR) repeat protein
MRKDDQKHARARCLSQLGYVSLERFHEAKAAGQPESELLRLLNEAFGHYLHVLDFIPADAISDLAIVHNQLGEVYKTAGDLDGALPHYHESIRYMEAHGNLYGAAHARRNVAVVLAKAGRLSDARQYAQAALAGFERSGPSATAAIQMARKLLQGIDHAFQAQKG